MNRPPGPAPTLDVETTGRPGAWRWRLAVNGIPVHMGHRHYPDHDTAVQAAVDFIHDLIEVQDRSGVPWSFAASITPELPEPTL